MKKRGTTKMTTIYYNKETIYLIEDKDITVFKTNERFIGNSKDFIESFKKGLNENNRFKKVEQ